MAKLKLEGFFGFLLVTLGALFFLTSGSPFSAGFLPGIKPIR